jgi:outer membrane protein OmpA-like peptidoglycan-associated protein
VAEASPKERPKLTAGKDTGQPTDDLETLRGIIVGPEKTRIHRLEERLDESETRADNLIDTDMQALQEIRQRIEGVRILFPFGASAITPDQEPLLTHLARDIHAVETLSKQLDRAIGLRIVGYTEVSNSKTANLKLSQDRAEAVRRFLIDNGKVNIAIMAVGMGSNSMADDHTDERLRAGSRFAGFELFNDAGTLQGKDR